MAARLPWRHLFIHYSDMKISKPQQTVIVILCGMILFYFVFKWTGFLYIASVLLLTGLLSPTLTEKIHWAWMKLAMALGYINNRILLTLIFFLVLTPLAFLMKFFGKTALQLKDNNTGSLFKMRNHLYKKEDLENTW